MKLDDLAPCKICTKLVWTILSLSFSLYIFIFVLCATISHLYSKVWGHGWPVAGLGYCQGKTEHSWLNEAKIVPWDSLWFLP